MPQRGVAAASTGPRVKEDRDVRAVARRTGRRGRAGRRGSSTSRPRRPGARGPNGRGGPRLVVVLDEAQQPLPGSARSACRWPRTDAGVLVREPVVEPLVVAVVEALLLERVLHVPVGLGDEQSSSCVERPIPARTPSAGRLTAPQVRAKTSLVISIAMSQRTPSHMPARSRQQRAHRRAQRGRERVELDDVRPGREVRIAAAGDDRAAHPQPRGRVAREVVLGACG